MVNEEMQQGKNVEIWENKVKKHTGDRRNIVRMGLNLEIGVGIAKRGKNWQ